MTKSVIKIGVAGAHSTGKSTYVNALKVALEARGQTVGVVSNLAKRAREIGFPILEAHTVESTLWIIGQMLSEEARLSLTCQVILVDRPVLDALAYLEAALEFTQRTVEPRRLDALRVIVGAHTGDYRIMIATRLDDSVPLGDGRHKDPAFRALAAAKVEALTAALAPMAWRLTPDNREALVVSALHAVEDAIDA